MSTFNAYRVNLGDGSAEHHENKRDALRAAKAEANRTDRSVTVEVTAYAGRRYDPSAVQVRGERIVVLPRARR